MSVRTKVVTGSKVGRGAPDQLDARRWACEPYRGRVSRTGGAVREHRHDGGEVRSHRRVSSQNPAATRAYPFFSPTVPHPLRAGRRSTTLDSQGDYQTCVLSVVDGTTVRGVRENLPSPPCPLPTIAHSASRRALDWTQRAHHLESLRCGCTRIRTLHPMPMKSTWPWPRHTRRFCVRVTVLPKRMRYSPIHFPTFLAMVGRELSPKGAPILPSCSSAAASALLRSSATLRRHPWQTLRRIWAWTGDGRHAARGRE